MLKNISRRDLIRRLRLFDFDGPYSGGRHFFMVKGALKVRVPNPHGKDISRELVSEILRQANVSIKEWKIF